MERLQVNSQMLTEPAQTLVASGKGVLAMDECNSTCGKSFAALGIPQTEEYRRAYRDWIVTTPKLRADATECRVPLRRSR